MSDHSGTSDNEQKKGIEWTDEKLRDLYSFITSIAEKYVFYKTKQSEHDNKFLEAASKHDRKIIYVLLTFLGSVIIGMSVLTFFGKVSGEALLFAIGGIVGYVFALIQRFIFGSQSSPEQPDA